MTSYEEGFLMGVLVGEGHFGGDRLRPHVILHMHARQEKLLTWFLTMVPGSKLYGPREGIAPGTITDSPQEPRSPG